MDPQNFPISAALSSKQPDAELTETSQCNAEPAHTKPSTTEEDLTCHPGTFSFPTLGSDGSVPDLRAPRSHRYPPTPPAALSSLGAKSKMPHENLADSTTSLADSQYDMLEDVSDISNDDRETVSLGSASTEHQESDGQDTPSDTGSLVDVEEERDPIETSNTLGGSSETLLEQEQPHSDSQMRAENELLDSYMADDLETPRQSTLGGGAVEQAAPRLTTPDLTHAVPSHLPYRLGILFVAERRVTDAEIIRVCHRMISRLTGSESAATAMRFPPTPSGINPTSGLLLQIGDIELEIEHCVDADLRGLSTDIRGYSTRSYSLQIQDSDKEHTSFFTVGRDGKIDLKTKDLAVLYLTEPKTYPIWFSTVQRAMERADVPTITTGAPEYNFDDLRSEQRDFAYYSGMVVSNKTFFDDNEMSVWVDLMDRLHRKLPSGKQSGKLLAFRKASAKRLIWKDVQKRLILPLLVTLGFFLLGYFLQPNPNPVAELAIRRDALSTALVEVTNSTEATKLFDLEHLLPQPTHLPNGLSSTVRFQGARSNVMVISIPKKIGSRYFPQIACTKVYRTPGTDLAFNLTTLIEGVHHVALAPEEAYGYVTVNITTKNPPLNFPATHNFGSRMLQRKTYEKASTDLSKTFNKDVAVASQRMKSLKERLGLEITAGAVATKNVTTQLVVYAVRDLQLYAHTAVSVLGKAVVATKYHAERLEERIDRQFEKLDKEFEKIDRGFEKVLLKTSKNLQKTISSTAEYAKSLVPSKKAVGASLAASRERALGLKNRLSGQKKDTNSTSATKELSLRLQNIFKPCEKSKRAGSLSDIARCVRSEDYLACRKEQKPKQKAVAAYQPPGGLAKIPEQDLMAKATSKYTPSSCNTLKCKKAERERKKTVMRAEMESKLKDAAAGRHGIDEKKRVKKEGRTQR